MHCQTLHMKRLTVVSVVVKQSGLHGSKNQKNGSVWVAIMIGMEFMISKDKRNGSLVPRTRGSNVPLQRRTCNTCSTSKEPRSFDLPTGEVKREGELCQRMRDLSLKSVSFLCPVQRFN